MIWYHMYVMCDMWSGSRSGAVAEAPWRQPFQDNSCVVSTTLVLSSTYPHWTTGNMPPWTVPLLLAYFHCMSACVSFCHCLTRQFRKHVPATTSTHATIEQLLDSLLYTQVILYLRKTNMWLVHLGTVWQPNFPPAKLLLVLHSAVIPGLESPLCMVSKCNILLTVHILSKKCPLHFLIFMYDDLKGFTWNQFCHNLCIILVFWWSHWGNPLLQLDFLFFAEYAEWTSGHA
jgi:hypothetical protein